MPEIRPVVVVPVDRERGVSLNGVSCFASALSS